MNYTKVSRAASLRSARIAADIQTLINNRSYYKFQYTPLTGPLPGLSFEQQTEDAINDIGNMSYGSYEIATQALTTANQAYNAAQSAIEIANHAETTAQNAQTTANNAATAAANAQTAADNAATAAANAQTTADNAATAAANAQETADNAQASANTAIATATDAQTTADNAQNDATSALNRLDSLTPVVEELRYYDNIDTAVDLNDKTEFARELLEASNNTNAPETGSGWLDVDDDFNETYIRQKFMGQASGKTYVRFGTIVPDSDPVEVSEWTAWVEYAVKTDLDSTTTELTERITTVADNLATHEADYNNPHKVTAEQLGLATVYVYKDSVATYADLPTSGQKIGDVYNIETADPDHGIKAGDNVAWNGEKWDVLAGNHDLSGYAQLNSANTFTALNTFRANINVSNGTAAGSQGQVVLGTKPSTATVQANIISSTTGALNYIATENTGHYFKIGNNTASTSITTNESETAILSHNAFEFARITNVGIAKWLGNANTATKLETARTINGVAFDGTQDITIEAGGGGGDVTAAGNNTFTGTNAFQKTITVSSGAAAGSEGVINLGIKNALLTTQASISAGQGGDVSIRTSENQSLTVYNGTYIAAAMAATETTARLDMIMNRILDFSTSSGLQVGAGSTGNIYFNPTTADTKGSLRLRSVGAMDFNGNELQLNKNGDFNEFSDTTAIKFNNNTILAYSNAFKNLSLKAMGDDNILELGVAQGAWNIQLPNNNGDVRIANRLYVGNKNGVGAGVISGENSEQCLYFMGTAENTYYATPNTGNTISYQSSANCYLINCSINNPSSLNMNFSGMNFKATVGSVPYMCKTLTFWLAVGATVPTVAWTFPTGSAVYYPKGVAPALTANANNIINVIAIVDDTGSFSIQVCDSVALPFSG